MFFIVEDADNNMGGTLTQENYRNAENGTFHRIAYGFEMNNDSSPNIFQGDILHDELDLIGEVTPSIDKKWPKTGNFVVVTFTFPSDATKQQKADIAKVVKEFGSETCIR